MLKRRPKRLDGINFSKKSSSIKGLAAAPSIYLDPFALKWWSCPSEQHDICMEKASVDGQGNSRGSHFRCL